MKVCGTFFKGNMLFGCEHGTVRYYNKWKAECDASLDLHDAAIVSLQADAEERMLLARDYNSCAVVWDVRNGNTSAAGSANASGNVNGNGNGNGNINANANGRRNMAWAERLSSSMTPLLEIFDCHAADMAKDGRLVAASVLVPTAAAGGSGSGSVYGARVYDTATMKVKVELSDSTPGARANYPNSPSIALSPSGNLVLNDGVLWDLRTCR